MLDWLLANFPTVILSVVAIYFVGADFLKARGVWKDAENKKINKKLQEKEEADSIMKALSEVSTKLDTVLTRLDSLEERVSKVEGKVEDLISSDMHDIKSWIVDQYHKFYTEQGWIDAFSAETIDRRYNDYLKEGGNSYIKVLIDRLHCLPMDPPAEQQKKKQ